MADADHDHTSAPWPGKSDAAFWGVTHQHSNSTLEHDQGCPRRYCMNKHSEYNTTMADADASSAAITASACPTCGQHMPQDFTNTQTMMAQANQRRVSFAGTAAPANQPAPIWSSWDPTFPVQHILQVDHMLETGSAYRQPPERHEADIAQFQMDIDAIHAPNMPTDFAIDPQLLDANSMAFVPVQTTAEWVQSSIPPAVSLQHISYPAVAPQINPVGYFGAMEQHTVTNTDVADVYTRGIRELGPTRREQIQQSHNAPTSEPDHHGTTIYKCQECGVEFARRDGLRHHQESHTDKAHRYKCKREGCSYAGGRYPKDLVRHDLTHVKPAVAPFSCEWASCTKKFHRRDNLLRHLRQDHAEPTALLEVPTNSPKSSRNLRRTQSRSSGGHRMRRTTSSASAATLSSFDSAEMSNLGDHLMPPPQNVLAVTRRVSSSFGEEFLTSFDDSSSMQSYARPRLTPRTSQSSSGDPAFSSGHNSFRGA